MPPSLRLTPILLGLSLLAAPGAGALLGLIGEGPSRDPSLPSEKNMAKLDRLVRDMEDRWEALDAGCDPDAVFALTYLITTRGVRDHIAEGYFEDGDNMATFTLAFADMYLSGAWDTWHEGDQAVRTAWREAFTWADSGYSTVYEDLMLGMNAHINDDLAVVAWRTGQVSGHHKADYDRINHVLADVMPEIAHQVALRYAPTMDVVSNPLTDPAVLETLYTWREGAWHNAGLLTYTLLPGQRHLIDTTIETEAGLLAETLSIEKPLPTEDARTSYCMEQQV